MENEEREECPLGGLYKQAAQVLEHATFNPNNDIYVTPLCEVTGLFWVLSGEQRGSILRHQVTVHSGAVKTHDADSKYFSHLRMGCCKEPIKISQHALGKQAVAPQQDKTVCAT